MALNEDLEKIGIQERALHLPRLDAQFAWDLGTRIRALATERGLSLVIDVRRFGQPLFYSALEGTTADNAEWLRPPGRGLRGRRRLLSPDCRERGHRGQRDRVRTAAARRSQPGCGSAVRVAGTRFCGIAPGAGERIGSLNQTHRSSSATKKPSVGDMPGNKRSALSGVRLFRNGSAASGRRMPFRCSASMACMSEIFRTFGSSERTAATTCSFSSGSNEQVE